MRNPQFIDALNLDQDVSRRLSQSLLSVEEGSQEEYRSPFLNGLTPSEILAKFDETFLPLLDDLPLVLKDMELSNRGKFGPRSLMKPWHERRESLKQYFSSDNFNGKVNLPASHYARLRPLSLDKANMLLKNNTSSGLPYLTKKGTVKDKTLAQSKSLQTREDPCVLYTRTQEGNKTRNVWGYPMVDTLIEMSVFAPLLKYHKAASPWRSSLGGPCSVDKRITHLFAKKDGRNLLSVDFSSYDATVKASLQGFTWEYIKSLFQAGSAELIETIAKRFLNIGIVTPEGVWEHLHGVPSGSTFTNEIDSDAQYLISRDFVDTDNDGDITGDDGAYLVANVDELLQGFEDAGLVVNHEKTHIANDYFIYLQNYYSEQYTSEGVITGIYPIYRALMKIVFQRRWVSFEENGLTGIDYYAIRAISILENCRYHPHFKQLVQFVVTHDKYGLATSDKGIAKYVEMIRQSSGLQGILQNQRGDEMKGIRNFATFRMISEMSA